MGKKLITTASTMLTGAFLLACSAAMPVKKQSVIQGVEFDPGEELQGYHEQLQREILNNDKEFTNAINLVSGENVQCYSSAHYQKDCNRMMRGWEWVLENPEGQLPPPEYFDDEPLYIDTVPHDYPKPPGQ